MLSTHTAAQAGTPGLRSVVVPAHNEQHVISDCLTRLLEGLPAEASIVVACNGCTDDTAAIARRFGPRVLVLDLERPSKTAALTAADQHSRGFPRAYVDADINVTGRDLDLVARRMSLTGIPAGAPQMTVECSQSSWAVRAFYRHWATTHYRTTRPIGSGVYVLSASGRARFPDFPEIIADDEFVRHCFASQERLADPPGTFVVHAPLNVRALIAIKTRAKTGERQLAELIDTGPPTGQPKDMPSSGIRAAVAPMLAAARRPATARDLVIYLTIRMAARARSRMQRNGPNGTDWFRDESSREKRRIVPR